MIKISSRIRRFSALLVSRPGHLVLILAASLMATDSMATYFRTKLGPNRLEGVVDVELAYGLIWRAQNRDSRIIGFGNGGDRLDNANMDDGNLNYDQGELVSNMVRATGELTLQWGRFGGFIRGYTFYDYENEQRDRDRTRLTKEAKDQVGSGTELLDAYLSVRFEVREMPLQFRIGEQVVSWGESRFFPADGVNVANPLDIALFQQPTSTPRDLRKPVGMLWGFLQPTPFFAIEGYYQYDWDKTVLPATGTYFGTSDPIFPGGRFSQAGPFSDQGTNVDAAFGLPPGTVGFVPNWFQIPRASDERPSDQGQFGINLQLLLPELNDTKFSLYYANYHSKLPSVGAIGPPVEAYEAYSGQGIAARTAELIQQGVVPANAEAAGVSLQFNEWLNATRIFAHYPENIKMLGFSFNTTSLRTGTAYFGEISHHFDAPILISPNQLIDELLPGSTEGDFLDLFPPVDLNSTNLEALANKRVEFTKELDKSFLTVGATQLLGPRLGAAQMALTAELSWMRVWDFPRQSELLIAGPGLSAAQFGPRNAFGDKDSWGYRLAGNLTYNNVFGAVTLRPRVLFTQDVSGNSPAGAGPFRDGKKSFTVGLRGEYVQSLLGSISYTTFWGAGKWNSLNDRDFVKFSIRYDF